MPFASQHAAPEVEEQVFAHQRAMNDARYIPETPSLYKQISEENRIFIFNVGPWAHRRELGSAGTYNIQACPAGREYSDPVVINGVVEEPYPISEVECKVMPTDGVTMAMQILGEGPFIPKSSSFAPFGVFISKTEKPDPAIVAAAKKRLQEKYLEGVNEANLAFADGTRELIRPDFHFVCARALKKSEAECGWLKGTEVGAERANCPSCGTIYVTGVMKCKECGFILDKKRFDKAVADGLFA